MLLDMVDQYGYRDPCILQHERVEADRSIIDVSDSHGEDIDQKHDWVLRAPNLILNIDNVRSHKRDIQLHRLDIEEFEVDVLTRGIGLWLLNIYFVVVESVFWRNSP